MRDHPPSPFTPEEILVLRGMIDDHVYELRRERFWRSTWGNIAKGIGALGALAVVAESLKGLFG